MLLFTKEKKKSEGENNKLTFYELMNLTQQGQKKVTAKKERQRGVKISFKNGQSKLSSSIPSAGASTHVLPFYQLKKVKHAELQRTQRNVQGNCIYAPTNRVLTGKSTHSAIHFLNPPKHF